MYIYICIYIYNIYIYNRARVLVIHKPSEHASHGSHSDPFPSGIISTFTSRFRKRGLWQFGPPIGRRAPKEK